MDQENLIAVVGMSGRFPQARSVDELWKNLLEGKDCIQQFTKEELEQEGTPRSTVEATDYKRAKGIVENSNAFDADFFGYTVKEAMIIDPQSRVFLEEVWKAIEDSGTRVSDYPGRVGLYAGAGMNTYLLRAISRGVLQQYDDFDLMLGSDKDLLATRVAYKLNFTGPSLTVQTTCSTSLVAVHLACQGLLAGDCDMAVAGGVSISYPIKQGYQYRKGMIFSQSGHCRPFEAHSDGTVFSDGVGVVVLKRLEDALEAGDDIYGVICGTAVNNDGSNKVGFTAPSPVGQAEVIRDCLSIADIPVETIRYVEAHGTATEIGDMLELKAISQVYEEQSDRRNYCAIGSVKANVGHLNTASGITGLIKALLVLRHGVIPAMPRFEEINPKLNLADSPFYINRENVLLERTGTERVAVSSFGIGGTNAHAILERAPQMQARGETQGAAYAFPFSAKTQSALLAQMDKVRVWLEEQSNLALCDVASTLQTGREVFAVRNAVVAASCEQLVEKLSRAVKEEKTVKSTPKPVYFMVTGQGSQYVDMAKGLYEGAAAFREIVDRGAKYLRDKYQLDVMAVLYPSHQQAEQARTHINQTEYAQPILFVLSYALGRYLMTLGIQPDKIIGHSLGEYVGACLAEVMTFEEGLDIVYGRGKILQAAPTGQMLAVQASPAVVGQLNLPGVSVSAVNAPEAVVLGGTREDIQQAKRLLGEENILCYPLSTSHAFHTPIMEGAAEEFRQFLRSYTLRQPKIGLISNATGQLAEGDQLCHGEYWYNHVVKPVLFEQGVRQLLHGEDAIFIEIGAGRTLIDLAKQQTTQQRHLFVDLLPGRYSKQQAHSFFLEQVATLWANGVSVDFAFLQGENGRKIHMPTYQFDAQIFSLLDIGGQQAEHTEQRPAVAYKANISRAGVQAEWVAPRDEVEELLLGLLKENMSVENIGVLDNFFELGLNSLSASQYALLIRQSIDLDVEIQEIIEAGCVAELAKVVALKLLEDDGADPGV